MWSPHSEAAAILFNLRTRELQCVCTPGRDVWSNRSSSRRLIRKLACGLGLRGATKTHSGRNLLSIKRLCSKRGIGRSTSVGLFSNSEPDKVQRVIPQRAATEATAGQRRPGATTQPYRRGTGGSQKSNDTSSGWFPKAGTSLSLGWSRSGFQLHTPYTRS